MDQIGYLVIAFFVGGLFGVFTMSLMNTSSDSDDLLLGDKQYEE